MQKLRVLFLYVTFLFTFVSSFKALALTPQQKVAVENLLQQEHRPTVTQVIEAFDSWPETNVFYEYQNSAESIAVSPIDPVSMEGIRNIVPQQLDLGIRSIAILEKAFPGAVFSFLGRDSVFTAEVFEALFLQISTEKRVFRLNASGPSFARHHYPEDMMWQFANTNGLSEEILFKRPYLMLDTTSFNHQYLARTGQTSLTSQSTRLTFGIYEHLKKQGIEPHQLVRWINFVNLRGNLDNLFPIFTEADKDTEDYFKIVIDELEKDPRRTLPPRILSTHLTYDLTYGNIDWHGSFGELRVESDGVVRGTPPRENPKSAPRLFILARIYELYSKARQLDVLSELVSAAEEFGYDYTEVLKAHAQSDSNNDRSRLQGILDGLEERRWQVEEEQRLTEERERLRREAREQKLLERNLADIENLAQRQKQQSQMRSSNAARLSNQRLASILIEEAGLQLTARFDYELVSAAVQLPLMTLNKQTEEGGYFSSNGKLLQEQILQTYFGRAANINDEFLPFDANKRVIQYLKSVALLYNMGRLSSRDLRRLTLFAMEKMDPNAPSFAFFEGFIADNETLKDLLIERATVFVTSKKNMGVGQVIYKAFVEKGWLPEPDCAPLLDS